MDIFEMLEILVDLDKGVDKNLDSRIRELEKEGEMVFLTLFYTKEEPKVGITLLKVTPSI